MYNQIPSLQDSMAFILPIFFLLLLHPLLSSSLPRSSNLIEKTCGSTIYYDFCVSSLSSSPQITNPANTTIKTLTTAIINLSISNATNTSSFVSSLSKSTANPSLSSLLRTCAEKYMHAREALQSSLVAVEDEEYDYAFVHVSAAAEYPNVCRVLFRRSGDGVAYPAEVGRREEVVERLCAVALGIISVLLG